MFNNLFGKFANQNIDVTVIVPSPINIRPKLLRLPLYAEEKTDSGKTIKIYRPKYIGCGQSNILGFNPAKITTKNFTNQYELYETLNKTFRYCGERLI